MFHRLGLRPGRGGESPHGSGIADREERHAGQVEITKDKRGEYRFRLKELTADLAVSEGYKTKDVLLTKASSPLRVSPRVRALSTRPASAI